MLLVSCGSKVENEVPLSGEMAVFYSDGTCVIYDSGDVRSKLVLPDDSIHSYSGMRWLHGKDVFIGVEYRETGDVRQRNVVQFDVNEQRIDQVYQSEEGELASSAFPSPDGTKLLVTFEKNREGRSSDNTGQKPVIKIFDLPEKRVVREIAEASPNAVLELQESPWLSKGNAFVYSVPTGIINAFENEVVDVSDGGYAGVYVYDLDRDQKKLIVLGGRLAIAAPSKNEIAYVKDNSLRVMNLDDNVEKVIVEFGSNDKIANIHWSPDGRYIYMAYFHLYFGLSDLFTIKERLVEVSTGEERPFRKVAHGFHSYTWRQ